METKGSNTKGQLFDLYTWAKVVDETVKYTNEVGQRRDSINIQLGKLVNDGIYTGANADATTNCLKSFVQALTETESQLVKIKGMLKAAGEEMIKTAVANANTDDIAQEATQFKDKLSILED